MSNEPMFGQSPRHKILVDGSNHTGSYGEIIVDLTLPGLRIHDGSCCGGIMIIRGEPSECATAMVAAKATATTKKSIASVVAPAPVLPVTSTEKK